MIEIEKLYTEYFTPIYRFLLSLGASKSLAEELTAQTMFIAINKIDSFKKNYILNNPKVLYEKEIKNIEILKDNLNDEINNIIKNNTKHIDTLKIKLDLLNPENILDKGYSIVYKDNKIIKDIKDINISDNINIVVKTGKINANVKGVSNNE